jgi:hypothetical protein
MQYMKLDDTQREELLESLTAMSAYLGSAFRGLSPEQLRARGRDGGFSPVEQVWHLADLEREGFAAFMAQHDSAHRGEIEQWKNAVSGA